MSTYLDYLGERLADHPEAVTAMCRLAHINRQWAEQWMRHHRRGRRSQVRRLRAARRARRVLGVRRG